MFKRLLITLAVVLCAGVLLFPLTAYAAEEAEYIDAEDYSEPEDDLSLPEDGFSLSMFGISPEDIEAFMDAFSGDIFGLMQGNFTPDGTATVIDNVFIDGNGLEFFTFTTDAGNVFYLIIDRWSTKNNVYFLNAVTEWDLIALAVQGEVTGGNGTSTSGIPTISGSGGAGKDTPGEPEAPDEPPAKKGGGNTGMLIFLLIGVVGVGGAAYYFKIVKGKKNAPDDDIYDGDDYDESDYDGDPDETDGDDEFDDESDEDGGDK